MSLPDSFEDGDVSEYAGDTGIVSVVNDPALAYDGDWFLSLQQWESVAITTMDTTVGYFDTPFGCFTQGRNNLTWGGMMFGVPSASGHSDLTGYQIEHYAGDSFRINRWDSGEITGLESSFINTNRDEWYETRVTEWTEEGSITAELLNTNGNVITQVQVTDSTYAPGGYGFEMNVYNTGKLDIDDATYSPPDFAREYDADGIGSPMPNRTPLP